MSSEERINQLLDLLSSVPEGKMLVDLVKQNDVRVFFAAELAREYDYRWLAGGYTRGYYDTEKKTVALCERVNDFQLLRTLAHELSHLHQHQYIPFDMAEELPLRDCAILARLIEGEADARAARVIQAINRTHGKDILLQCRGGFRPMNWLVGKFCSAVKVAENSFVKFQASRTAEHYDREALAEAMESDVPKVKSLKTEFNKASIAGLFKNGDTLYMDAKTMPELIDKIDGYMPRFL